MKFTKETAQDWIKTYGCPADIEGSRYDDSWTLTLWGMSMSPQAARRFEAAFENISISTGFRTRQIAKNPVSNAGFARVQATTIYVDLPQPEAEPEPERLCSI